VCSSDLNTALNPRFYEIESLGEGDAMGLSVTAADTDDENDRAVILTTSAQSNRSYRLRATNVTARADGFPIDPSRSASTFLGLESDDTTGPELVRADSTSSTTVLLTFSEPLAADAADPVNFSITCSSCADEVLQVLDAFMTRHNTQIILETHPQEANVEYRVSLSNANGHVTDQSIHRNPIEPDPSTATFVFAGQPSLQPGAVLPRVVGAISLGNTSVLVTFSKPMGDSALALASYSIVQENVNSEVGSLAIRDDACAPGSVRAGQPCETDDDCLNGTCQHRAPRFQGSDRTAVVLTTSSQNEVTYRVTVVNVRDLAGNQLAPRELLVDPTSATFAGTPAGGGQGPIVDSDADGVSDAAESRGRVVTVVLSNGEVTQTEVTSDPFAADTDGDGLDDGEERRLNTNPRSSDTDGDQLSDAAEYNV